MKLTEEERMELAIQQNMMFERMANEVKDRHQVHKVMEHTHMMMEEKVVGKDDFEDF